MGLALTVLVPSADNIHSAENDLGPLNIHFNCDILPCAEGPLHTPNRASSNINSNAIITSKAIHGWFKRASNQPTVKYCERHLKSQPTANKQKHHSCSTLRNSSVTMQLLESLMIHVDKYIIGAQYIFM